MNKITVLKSDFQLDEEIEKTKAAMLEDQKNDSWGSEGLGAISLVTLHETKRNSVVITEEEIDQLKGGEVDDWDRGFNYGIRHFWKYIQSRINQ